MLSVVNLQFFKSPSIMPLSFAAAPQMLFSMSRKAAQPEWIAETASWFADQPMRIFVTVQTASVLAVDLLCMRQAMTVLATRR